MLWPPAACGERTLARDPQLIYFVQKASLHPSGRMSAGRLKAPPHNSRLGAQAACRAKIFRDIFQKCSPIRQGLPALFGSSHKKFFGTLHHLGLCGVALILFFRDRTSYSFFHRGASASAGHDAGRAARPENREQDFACSRFSHGMEPFLP